MEQQEIEFSGGPLDGLTHRTTAPPRRLPSEIGLPVNPSLLSFLAMERPQDEVRDPATSIAVYKLEQGRGTLRYCHLCSVAEVEYERKCA